MASVLELLTCRKFSLIHAFVSSRAGVKYRKRVGGRGGERDIAVELSFVCIAMELYSMPADDTTEVKHVDGEKSWTKTRALGDPTGNGVGGGT